MAQEIRFPRLNSVMLSGRLTRDVELRYTPKGNPVAKMSIAFNRIYRDSEGNWQEESHFVDVSCFGRQADDCAQKLHKGSPIIVEGYINTYSYTTNDNQQRKVVEIIANKIHFLEKQYSQEDETNRSEKVTDDFEANEQSNITDDDVPF